jgi:hypothetical protein
MSNLEPYYRSPAAKAMAEKVANSDVYASLDVTVNIDNILPNRDKEVAQQINEAITNNKPFGLFSDKSNYIIIIPSKFTVACYASGVQQTFEVMNDAKQFQNRVKIAFAVYDKFIGLDRLIEGGGNGDEPLPVTGERKNLPDGEEGQG